MPFGEVYCVVEHVELRKRSDTSLGDPVLMNISHSRSPGVDLGRLPVLGMEQGMMHFCEPTGDDGMSRADLGSRLG